MKERHLDCLYWSVQITQHKTTNPITIITHQSCKQNIFSKAIECNLHDTRYHSHDWLQQWCLIIYGNCLIQWITMLYFSYTHIILFVIYTFNGKWKINQNMLKTILLICRKKTSDMIWYISEYINDYCLHDCIILVTPANFCGPVLHVKMF